MNIFKGTTKTTWLAVFSMVVFLWYLATIPSRLISKIEIEMSRSEVITQLGNRRYREIKDLRDLCVINSWVGCQSALASGSKSYIEVNIGVDTVILIGLNDENKVIFKALGDT